MTDLNAGQWRQIHGHEPARPHVPLWAIVDLNLLALAQETAGNTCFQAAQVLGAEHAVVGRMKRLKRELKAVRADAALVPDDHEALDERECWAATYEYE